MTWPEDQWLGAQKRIGKPAKPRSESASGDAQHCQPVINTASGITRFWAKANQP